MQLRPLGRCFVRVTNLEGIAGRRHSPTLSPSHGIPPCVWFVYGQSLVAETIGVSI